MVHHLKTLPDFFQSVIDNRKPFEIRENDRRFKIGDIVVLEEFVKTEYIQECSHYQEYVNNFDFEYYECLYENCRECVARCGKCHDFVNHIYTGRTCTVIIKDIFDISFLITDYVAFTFDIKHIRY